MSVHAVLGIKPRALHRIGKCSVTELHPSPGLALFKKEVTAIQITGTNIRANAKGRHPGNDPLANPSVTDDLLGYVDTCRRWSQVQSSQEGNPSKIKVLFCFI
jgi:hypothetical protein